MSKDFEVKFQGCCAYIVARDNAGNLEQYSLQDFETGIVTLESKVAFMSVSDLDHLKPTIDRLHEHTQEMRAVLEAETSSDGPLGMVCCGGGLVSLCRNADPKEVIDQFGTRYSEIETILRRTHELGSSRLR